MKIVLPFPSSASQGRRRFSADEIEWLLANYPSMVKAGHLTAVAEAFGRTKSALAEKAGALGLTDRKAAGALGGKAAGDKLRGKPLAWEHPRGFAGKQHSQEAIEKCTEASRSFWAGANIELRNAASDRMSAVGRGNTMRRANASWKSGWREIGGKRNYYRSRWEANYARYLEWMKSRGLISDWKHEPETFWFDGIKRGVRSYLPDFRVWEVDGSTKLYEIKGWMDARSKTTIRRMAKYHPQEVLIVVREREYNQVAKICKHLIPDWETSGRSDRA